MLEFIVVAALLAAAALLAHPPWRRRFLSDRILAVYRRIMPAMSATERDAIAAGTVWWEGELFGGRPDWDRLLSYPAPRLSPAEQAFLDGPVETLCGMLDDWEVSHELLDLPPQAWQFIRDNGFLGMIIPRRYGGLEFSALAHSEVVMKLSSRCNAAAVTVMVPNSLGPAELLLHYGTDAQKEHYLPRLAGGIEIPCFALTGPLAGSDAAAIPDSGDRSGDGRNRGHLPCAGTDARRHRGRRLRARRTPQAGAPRLNAAAPSLMPSRCAQALLRAASTLQGPGPAAQR